MAWFKRESGEIGDPDPEEAEDEAAGREDDWAWGREAACEEVERNRRRGERDGQLQRRHAEAGQTS